MDIARSLLLVACLGGAAAGCSLMPGPFVDNPDEFNRNSKNFNKVPEDIAEAVVCYNRANTTRAEIHRVAAEECARVGKGARFREHDIKTCPLFTPIGAVFDCTGGPAIGSLNLPWQGPRGGSLEWSPNFLDYGGPSVPGSVELPVLPAPPLLRNSEGS